VRAGARLHLLCIHCWLTPALCCVVLCCALCAAGKAWWEEFLQASYHKMGTQTPQVSAPD
jgi:hypothetical protein